MAILCVPFIFADSESHVTLTLYKQIVAFNFYVSVQRYDISSLPVFYVLLTKPQEVNSAYNTSKLLLLLLSVTISGCETVCRAVTEIGWFEGFG